ncbi:choice-of-anchor D domain-containing protein [Verrucomicrobiaceae bacterium E54]|nr:choice-of-anchor D domain-containing protein [Verrucomicrobiaceae bacterium E54]
MIGVTMLCLGTGGMGNAAPGDLDVSFGTGGMVTTDFGGDPYNRGFAVALQADGKIVVAGISGLPTDVAVVRYNSDGSLDTGFGGSGKVTTNISGYDNCCGVVVQPDGKIVVGGETGSADFALVRYESDGSLDTGFGNAGKVVTDVTGSSEFARGMALQADGKILLVGNAYNASQHDFVVVRYLSDGSLDTGFGSGGSVLTDIGANDYAYCVTVQSDGKILVAGYSTGVSAEDDFSMVRYHADGALDTTFDSDGKVTKDIGYDDRAYGVAVQPDGKIVIVGESYVSSIWYREYAMVRYAASGALDTGFGTSGKVTVGTGYRQLNDSARGVALQPDGRIVLAGESVVSNSDFSVARFEPDGGLDSTFGGGFVTTDIGGGNDYGQCAALQPDGQIVVAGYIYDGGDQDFAVVRYIGGDPEIGLEQPLGTDLVSGVSSVDCGAGKLGMSSTPVTFTITNAGLATLTIAGVSVSGGESGDFTVSTAGMGSDVAPGGTTSFTVTFSPSAIGNRTTTLNIGSNDADENPFTLTLSGMGLTALEAWRLQHFGQTENTGDAADTADPDHDGLQNLLEWACHSSPTQAGGSPVQAHVDSPQLKLLYDRSVEAVDAGAVFTVQWSETMAAGDWYSDGITESILSDDGTVQEVEATRPMGSGRLFMRLQVAAP